MHGLASACAEHGLLFYASHPVISCLQGVPFSVAGCADLLALFRCVSCRYKFSTDITKPVLMVSYHSVPVTASSVVKLVATCKMVPTGGCWACLHHWRTRDVPQCAKV